MMMIRYDGFNIGAAVRFDAGHPDRKVWQYSRQNQNWYKLSVHSAMRTTLKPSASREILSTSLIASSAS